jgi:hypothetical protein
MPDRVHAAVDPMQTASPEPSANRLLAQSKIDQLPASNDAVLPTGQVSHLPVTWGFSCVQCDPQNSPRRSLLGGCRANARGGVEKVPKVPLIPQ